MSHDWIEREVLIDASGERVWSVLTEAPHVAAWFGDSAEIDLRPGGTATFGWREEGTGVFRAVIERVEPPSFLSFRWARKTDVQPLPGESTLVEFSLTEDITGTLLRVVETGFASLNVSQDEQDKAAAENLKGWTTELAELKEYAERPSA
jgi:uncharacterized protein YndB with AHSA1/START domain